MARTRQIKPGFFTNTELAELDPICRLLFIGLWCIADREGRLKFNPKRIRAELLPYEDQTSIELVSHLFQLSSKGFLVIYGSGNEPEFIQINNFQKHQYISRNEKESEIPAPDELTVITKQVSNKSDTTTKQVSNKSIPIPYYLTTLPPNNPSTLLEGENSKKSTSEFAPSAPQENDREELIQKGKEKLTSLGIKTESSEKPTFGLAVAAMKKFLTNMRDSSLDSGCALLRDATDSQIGSMAGKAVQAIHQKGLGISDIHKSVREPAFYVAVLKQGIGEPKTVTAFYKHLMQMASPENGDFLHEYCHNAYKELEIANRE